MRSLFVYNTEYLFIIILVTARSSVFMKMFSRDDYMENIENRVPMTQHDADLIQELLRFIYTYKVKDLTTFAPALLPLADQVGLCW